MSNNRTNDTTRASVLAWSAHAANSQLSPEEEAATEVDEPPDQRPRQQPNHSFQRTFVRKQSEQHESLLTKALHPSDDDAATQQHVPRPMRRRSLNSNISIPSTADLTSDTGFTSPARTMTPSPPPPELPLHPLNNDIFDSNKLSSRATDEPNDITPTKRVAIAPTAPVLAAKDPAVEALTKKRCIQFACAAKPSPPTVLAVKTVEPAVAPKPAQEVPKRSTCIKFACPTKPTATQPEAEKIAKVPAIKEPSVTKRAESPCMLRKMRSPSSQRSNRSSTPRPASQSPATTTKPKYLAANRNDLERESCRFNEFAAGEAQEEDWIRLNRVSTAQKITINDTLKKENEIRRLGKEAEEEALEEEFEEELDNDDEDEDENDVDNLDDDDAEDQDEEDDDIEEDEDEFEFSDGYNTDNEIGFADSDAEEEDDQLQLWTTGTGYVSRLSGETPTRRRPSLSGHRSDSSSSTDNSKSRARTGREKTRSIKIRPGTPELPDSTDFVCGTLDEDRPAEKAYMNCIAAKRAERLRPVPQDIDPSFPTSEPDDDEDEHSQHGADSDEGVWVHGEFEDLDGPSDRAERQRRKGKQTSPKRYRSPPPKRHRSPAPKVRGRSPRRLADASPPKRLRSPCPQNHVVLKSPPASPQHGGAIAFRKSLAARPGLTQTKSLPRTSAMFHQHLKNRRSKPATTSKGAHVRGAIDIVKGLEQKRQRRKEKFAQKHCNRARKGQVPERRPQPGQGAERMRELGLHMAGKLGPDMHILSI